MVYGCQLYYDVSWKRCKNKLNNGYQWWVLSDSAATDYWLPACIRIICQFVGKDLSSNIGAQDVRRRSAYFYTIYGNTCPPYQLYLLKFSRQGKNAMAQYKPCVFEPSNLPSFDTHPDACFCVHGHMWHPRCHPQGCFRAWLKVYLYF